MKKISLFFLAFLFSILGISQNTQNIRGVVQDSESLTTIPGATVILLDSTLYHGTSADMDGNFLLKDIPVGRISLKIQMMGYEPVVLKELLLTSGKELYLNVKLSPAFQAIDKVVIEATKSGNNALNEMATLSARSFSVEETQKYAASFYDPGRMALAFTGVATAGDDLMNEISVRGNSPRGILWRLEGIEIPNPNHFGSLGSSGGGISMLSSSTLSSSDFYTGAFPSEFGNASAGVFDLNMRAGNNQTREHSVMMGIMGMEAATEGYFKKGKPASYLVNYRYSTFALLGTFYNPIGDVLPAYSDLSFKLNFPNTPIGSISVFGLGGNNNVIEDAEPDSTLWEGSAENDSFRADQTMGVIGIKNVFRINDNAYLKNVASMSINRYSDASYEHNLDNFDIKELYDLTTFQDDQITFNSSLNYKLDNRNTFKSGVNFAIKNYDFIYDNKDEETEIWTNLVDSRGQITQLDFYAHWKNRIRENLTSNIGFHTTYIPFNQSYSLEPRAAITYTNTRKDQWTLATGLHSKPEHTSTYFLNQIKDDIGQLNEANKNLEIPKALHVVLGHKMALGAKAVLNIEAYYQYHYDIPVENDSTSLYSIVNATDIWSIVGRDQFVSEGQGRNFGIDLGFQKSLENNFYLMSNASLYRAEYKTLTGDWHSSRYNGNYIFSLTAGKEWILKDSDKSISLNGKFLTSGGNRITPVDLEASLATGQGVYLEDQAFEDYAGQYLRFDMGIAYKFNRPNSTHSIMLDIQNVSGFQNVYTKYFDESTLQMETVYQLGLFPFFNYRIEIQGK